MLAAITLACAGLLHILATPRVHFLYDYGDSMVGPMLYNTLHSGAAFDWVTSPTLFIPEMLQYLAVTAVVPDAHWAIAITGVMNVVAIYLATRLLVNVALPERSRRGQILVAALGLLLFVGFGMLEIAPTGFAQPGDALELFTLSYTLPHYSATLIGTLLTVAFAGFWLRALSLRTRIWLGLVTVVNAFMIAQSNPLFVVWAVLPLFIAFAWMLLRVWETRWRARRAGNEASIRFQQSSWRNYDVMIRAFSFSVVLGAASYLGYASRKLLAHWMAADGSGYLKLHHMRETAQIYASQIHAFASTPLGFAEAVLYAVLFVIILSVAIRGLWEQNAARALLSLYVGAVAVLTTVGTVIVGQAAPRYSLPAIVFVTMMLPVFAVWRIPKLQAVSVPAQFWRWARVGVPIVTAFTLVITGIAVSQQRSAGADCLQSWIDEQDSAQPLVGAGSFWVTRPVASYLPKQSILQIYITSPLLWQNNAGEYARQSQIDYLLVSPTDDADAEIPDASQVYLKSFGQPASVTQCEGFEIWDYRGTAGQSIISQSVLGPWLGSVAQ